MLEKHSSPIKDGAVSYKNLTPKERVKALELAQYLDVDNQKTISVYGLITQQKLFRFYQEILEHSQVEEIRAAVNDTLNALKPTLEQVNPDKLIPVQQNRFAHIFNNMQSMIENLTANYQQVSGEIAELSDQLQDLRETLIKENKWLYNLSQKNELFFQEMSMYQAGANMKLADVEKRELPLAVKVTGVSQDQVKIQNLAQFKQLLFSRVKDLELTENVIMWQEDNLQSLRINNQNLIDEINVNINTGLAAWQNQFILTLTTFNRKQTGRVHKKDALIQVSEGIENVKQLQQIQQHLLAIISAVLLDQRNSNKKRKLIKRKMHDLNEQLNEMINNNTIDA
ncbi:toxic anion resistance protein [Weissella bombi]|uniref:Uncharacterized conserved protein YaaN involved in tellurite resistance n=1 Tax=Weissella bombi TaxID=1505725 RepID=A0A1C3ZWS0_9LACO|nr:toxic anion resistance protein [Weissella bombi]SCB86732.1 Uncharacterized conserved protein YaaN involved in tellurite resistance [Weissella bombi]